MDNLEELWCHSVRLNEKEYGKVVAGAISEEITCFITDTNYLYVYEQDKLANIELSTKIGDDKLKHVRFLGMHNAIFVASNYQLAVITRDLQSYVTQSLPSHITQLAWNPTETLLVVISENEDIILYSYSRECMFEIKSKIKLNADVPNSLYVGWGSQNTQFLGPKARQLKEKDVVKQIPLEYGPPTISWRGNGQDFAVNYYEDGQRFIKVFNNHLTPLNRTEKYVNLLEPVCMVRGQCIASCAVRNGVNTIVIFEKNCKVKSSFEVAENKGRIKEIKCHQDIDLLAVYSLDAECGYINIYLYTNGKWKLKQQLYYSSNREVCGFDWSNIHEPLYTLCRLVVFTSEDVEFHTFRFVINRCPSTTLAAVIDGRNIEFYNFTEKIIPPPMTFCSLDHTRPINRVLFHPQKLLCVLLDSKLQAVVIDVKNFHKLLISDELDLKNLSCFDSITWNENDVINIFIGNDYHDQQVVIAESSDVTMEIKTVAKVSHEYKLPYSDTTSLTSYKNFGDNVRKLFYLTKKIVHLNNSEIELDFSLSSNREFYVNDKKVCDGIMSCFVFQNYLILTSVKCRMHCICIEKDYEILCDKLDLTKIYSREIEQGARIVSVSNSQPPQIILQLPRGNLESNSCRLITVDVVENLLSEDQWKAAVDLMRTERLNWNLLVDLSPERFSEHIEDFVKAAEYCSLLTNIVHEFSSTGNVYENCLPDFAKINCDKTLIIKKILEYLISTDSIKNLMAIVSIQHKHISLKSALNSIKLMFEQFPANNRNLCYTALYSLLIKEDIKDILSAAYSLYSLDFVLFIFQNSAIDPKHYGSIIERLKRLSSVGLRYEMALRGQDVKNAVKYILRCKDFTSASLETFIVKHKLEEVAYNSLKPDSEHFELVTVLYATKLSRQQNYAEAGLILKQIGLLPQALEEYKKSLDWIEILGLLTSLEYGEGQKTQVLYDLANQLAKAHRVDEAVVILEHYNNDYRRAIEVLVDYKEFKKAIVLTKIYKAMDILDQIVIPTLNLYISDLNDKIEEHETTFKNYVDRLQVIRHEKKLKLEHAALGIYDGDDDLFSDSGSTISSLGSSRATSRSRGSTFSSKNRRKEEKKKIDLREGGYYEDIALIRAIHILYGTVFALGKEVRKICLIVEHNNVKLCQSVHEKLSHLHNNMIERIPEVWPEIFVREPEVVDNSVMAIIQNKADLDPQYCVPPSKDVVNLDWKVKIFS